MTIKTTLKNPAQALFDELIFRFDDRITVTTAALLAVELGVDFDPLNYDVSI